jgi:hypothetical protein
LEGRVRGETRALKREQEGLTGVLSELSNALTKHAATIGVASDVFQKMNPTRALRRSSEAGSYR